MTRAIKKQNSDDFIAALGRKFTRSYFLKRKNSDGVSPPAHQQMTKHHLKKRTHNSTLLVLVGVAMTAWLLLSWMQVLPSSIAEGEDLEITRPATLAQGDSR